MEIELCYFEKLSRHWKTHWNSTKWRSEQQNISRRKLSRRPKSNLKGMHLQPSDISRRLYCTSRPSWWSRRCPRRTNERPLKRDEEREKNAIYFCYRNSSKTHKIRRCALFGSCVLEEFH